MVETSGGLCSGCASSFSPEGERYLLIRRYKAGRSIGLIAFSSSSGLFIVPFPCVQLSFFLPQVQFSSFGCVVPSPHGVSGRSRCLVSRTSSSPRFVLFGGRHSKKRPACFVAASGTNHSQEVLPSNSYQVVFVLDIPLPLRLLVLLPELRLPYRLFLEPMLKKSYAINSLRLDVAPKADRPKWISTLSGECSRKVALGESALRAFY